MALTQLVALIFYNGNSKRYNIYTTHYARTDVTMDTADTRFSSSHTQFPEKRYCYPHTRNHCHN